MRSEFNRFVVLFEQLSQYTQAWLEKIPADKFDWVPIDNSSIKFGERVSKVTFRSLMTHLCISEPGWIEQLRTCENGAKIAIPSNPEFEAKMLGDDFIEIAKQTNLNNLASIKAFSPELLDKEIYFVNRKWSVMGMLWGMYAHRAFHLGNIDIYLRQADIIAPEFFEFPGPTLA